jgi:hypothetical protein
LSFNGEKFSMAAAHDAGMLPAAAAAVSAQMLCQEIHLIRCETPTWFDVNDFFITARGGDSLHN